MAAAADAENPNHGPPNPIFSLFSKVLQPLSSLLHPPQKPKQAKQEPQTKPAVVVVDDVLKESNPPSAVSFLDTPPSVSLKVESQEMEQDTNPVVLWQVYAIGGFFLLRWAWARWNERRGKKSSSDQDPPPAADNEHPPPVADNEHPPQAADLS